MISRKVWKSVEPNRKVKKIPKLKKTMLELMKAFGEWHKQSGEVCFQTFLKDCGFVSKNNVNGRVFIKDCLVIHIYFLRGGGITFSLLGEYQVESYSNGRLRAMFNDNVGVCPAF